VRLAPRRGVRVAEGARLETV